MAAWIAAAAWPQEPVVPLGVGIGEDLSRRQASTMQPLPSSRLVQPVSPRRRWAPAVQEAHWLWPPRGLGRTTVSIVTGARRAIAAVAAVRADDAVAAVDRVVVARGESSVISIRSIALPDHRPCASRAPSAATRYMGCPGGCVIDREQHRVVPPPPAAVEPRRLAADDERRQGLAARVELAQIEHLAGFVRWRLSPFETISRQCGLYPRYVPPPPEIWWISSDCSQSSNRLGMLPACVKRSL